MVRISILFFAFLLTSVIGRTTAASQANELSRSFEFRYFDNDPCASGQTDFKGQTAVFDTKQRVEFLRQYVEYAKDFFNDPGLDKKVVGGDEVEAALKKLKPQPLTNVRERILLYDGWKWLGFKQGLTDSHRHELATWHHGIELLGGRTVTSLPEFKHAFSQKGYYAIEYCVTE